MNQAIYQTCANISALREWVETHLNYATGTGDLWLPIVLTAKGPLYAEAIGLKSGFNIENLSPITGLIEIGTGEPIPYQQPIHLSDTIRQPLYHLAQQILSFFSAPPSVYLLQFKIIDQEIIFDRLFPFPSTPAIASVGVQEPDLFSCHWYCLQHQPILDLVIISP